MSEPKVFRADATFYIEAATHDEAQKQLEDFVADHMPTNFVVGWTLSEDPDDE